MVKAIDDSKLLALPEQLERAKASIRAVVEHPFQVLKRQFGYVKVRYGVTTRGIRSGSLTPGITTTSAHDEHGAYTRFENMLRARATIRMCTSYTCGIHVIARRANLCVAHISFIMSFIID